MVPEGRLVDRQVMAPAGEGVLVALNLSQPRLASLIIRAELDYVLPDAPPVPAFAAGCRRHLPAVTGDAALAVLEDRLGRRDALALRVPRLTVPWGCP